MKRYRIWTTKEIDEDHVFKADWWEQKQGYLEIHKGDDKKNEIIANFVPGSWYLVETLDDETIPSDSPKEAPQG